MIYLKKTEDGTVVAYCDSETLTLMTGAERADLEVSDEDWAAAGYCAHCEEEAIVLGPVWSLEELAAQVRAVRDRRLEACTWIAARGGWYDA